MNRLIKVLWGLVIVLVACSVLFLLGVAFWALMFGHLHDELTPSLENTLNRWFYGPLFAALPFAVAASGLTFVRDRKRL